MLHSQDDAILEMVLLAYRPDVFNIFDIAVVACYPLLALKYVGPSELSYGSWWPVWPRFWQIVGGAML